MHHTKFHHDERPVEIDGSASAQDRQGCAINPAWLAVAIAIGLMLWLALGALISGAQA